MSLIQSRDDKPRLQFTKLSTSHWSPTEGHYGGCNHEPLQNCNPKMTSQTPPPHSDFLLITFCPFRHTSVVLTWHVNSIMCVEVCVCRGVCTHLTTFRWLSHGNTHLYYNLHLNFLDLTKAQFDSDLLSHVFALKKAESSAIHSVCPWPLSSSLTLS